MAAAVVTAIEISPGELFDSAGAVTNWMRKIGTETKAAVIAKAPPNRSRARYKGRRQSGALVASIGASIARTAETDSVVLIKVRAKHAVYVLDGTGAKGTRYLYRETSRMAEAARYAGMVKNDVFFDPEPTRGLWMRLPVYGHFKTHHLRVRGQLPNNFLFDGYNVVARAHEALRPFRNPFEF